LSTASQAKDSGVWIGCLSGDESQLIIGLFYNVNRGTGNIKSEINSDELLLMLRGLQNSLSFGGTKIEISIVKHMLTRLQSSAQFGGNKIEISIVKHMLL
jgi:hypothetical protein